MKTRVYLTIDTECREERRSGGRVLSAAGYDTRIWGRFANQRRELGIGLLMSTLESHGLRGTFYLDPFGSLYFGKEGLREVVDALRARGHDVQLHAHPIQREADWITRSIVPPSDHMADYGVDAQTTLLREGAALLIEAGVASEQLCSFRAGNFGANNDTWRAMSASGLRISSNYNPCYAARGMKMRPERPSPQLFEVGRGIWELPITNLRQTDGSYRHLQITALSFLELRAALLQAHQLGLAEVTIVTHSFELLHLDSASERRGRLNRINYLRLRALCAFLARNGHRFEVETVAQLNARLSAGPPATDRPWPQGGRLLRYARLAEQLCKRIDARLPF